MIELTQKNFWSVLENNSNLYDPFIVELVNTIEVGNKGKYRGGLLKLYLDERIYELYVEIVLRTAPSIVKTTLYSLKERKEGAWDKNINFGVMVPYLTKEIVEFLKKEGLVGLDLNGNYFIVKDDFIAIRLDKKNNFRENKPIKNVFSRNSSIVGRFLLRQNKAYKSVNEIYNEIQTLGGNLVLSTVSKVLSELEDQLIISKKKSEIKLVQPQKLLMNLRIGYLRPSTGNTIKLKLPLRKPEAKGILDNCLLNNWIWSGEDSSSHYSVTTEIYPMRIYFLGELGKENVNAMHKDDLINEKFYNCLLYQLEKNDKYVLFDSEGNWASKIQSYLELSQLGKREKEIAENIEKDILSEFN